MQIHKHILYPEITENTLQLYSKAKFGDVQALMDIDTDLTALIKKEIPEHILQNCTVYAGNKHPLNIFCKKNSFIVAEKVSESLTLPLWVGEYTYTYSDAAFYDQSTNRKQTVYKPVLKDKDIIKPFSKSVILIDDSIVSGNTLQVSINELATVTNEIFCFFILSLSQSPFKEVEVNDYILKDKNIQTLINIVKNPDYTYTTQMIRTIDHLDMENKKRFVKSLTNLQLNALKNAYSVYFEKDLLLE